MPLELSPNNESHTDDSGNITTPLSTLEAELTTLAGNMNAANYRFLKLLAEFERREGYAGLGIASCAHWLNWKCGIGLIAAREKCRVARALDNLPLISESMRRGAISYCKVRALTRVATPKNEDVLLQVAECGTVTHVENTVRLYRRSDRARELSQANKLHDDRFVQCFVDEQGCVVLRGRFAPEQGALVMKAVQAANDALREAERDSRESSNAGAPDEPVDRLAARRAEAVALMAESYLASGAAPLAAGDRHIVTVHVDEAVLRDETADGRSELPGAVALPPATVRRLCCDTALITIIEDRDGNALHIGRKTRAIPPAMHRALRARDIGCRYPGCTNTRFTDAHHIIHWADGGETNLENLVLLCRRHHRYLHEHGFTIERAGPQLHFVRRDGRQLNEATLPHGALDELTQAHHDAGIDIDANTGVTEWHGERADYDWLLRSLHARNQPMASGPTAQSNCL